jgi:hypothetical protein
MSPLCDDKLQIRGHNVRPIMRLITIEIRRSQTKTVFPFRLSLQVIDAVDMMSMAFFIASLERDTSRTLSWRGKWRPRHSKKSELNNSHMLLPITSMTGRTVEEIPLLP